MLTTSLWLRLWSFMVTGADQYFHWLLRGTNWSVWSRGRDWSLCRVLPGPKPGSTPAAQRSPWSQPPTNQGKPRLWAVADGAGLRAREAPSAPAPCLPYSPPPQGKANHFHSAL